MENLFKDAAHALFNDCCTPETARTLAEGKNVDVAWAKIEASGFLDALIAEKNGGSGLTVKECLPIFTAAGYHALPLPFVDTVILRAALDLDQNEPQSALALASLIHSNTAQTYQKSLTGINSLVLQIDGELSIAPVENITDIDCGHYAIKPANKTIKKDLDFQAIGAFIEITQMLGAMHRILEMTVDYAKQRIQFGRAIGKFQAIQHQISILTELTHASTIAVELAAADITQQNDSLCFKRHRIAAAKIKLNESAPKIAEIAHAIHGAIGVTEEFDLYLYTKRLFAGRTSYGSESYWAIWLGEQFLKHSDTTLFDFSRLNLSPLN